MEKLVSVANTESKTIECLPIEVLLIILEYLSPQERFNLALTSPTISNVLPYCKTWIFSKKSSKTMTKFNDTVKRVETFVLRQGGSSISPVSFYALGMFHNELKHFECNDIKSESVRHLAQFCKNLQFLSISSISSFDDKDLRNGFQNLQVLKINCYSNEMKSADYFLSLKQLKVFELQDAVINIDSNNASVIEEPAPLEVLGLSYCKGSLMHIIRKCTQKLRSLDVSFTEIGDEEVQILVEKSPNIKCLNIEQCVLIKSTGFAHIGKKYGPNLDYLNVKGTSIFNSAISDLFGKCPKIIEQGILNLSWCMDLTNDGFVSVLTIFNRCLKSLVTFNTYISNAELEILSNICPNLEELDIGGCYSVSDEGILSVLRRCKDLKILRTVDHAKSRLSPEGQASVKERFPLLEVDF